MAGIVPNWADFIQVGAVSSNTHQVPGGDNIAIGDLIVVAFAWFDNFGAADTVSSISDGTANTYTQYGAYVRGNNVGGQINNGVFICDAAVASATQPTFVFTLTSGETGGLAIGYLNYSNQHATPRSQIATGVVASTTAITCNALTTAEANDLIVAYCSDAIGGNPRTVETFTGSTPDANYVTRVNAPNNSTSQDLLVVDRGSSTDPNGRVSSATSTAPRFNTGGTIDMDVDNFLLREAAAASGVPPGLGPGQHQQPMQTMPIGW